MVNNVVTEAIDKTELMTLEWVLKMLKKYPVNTFMGELETMIEDRKKAVNTKERHIEKDDDGFELPHLDPEDDPDTRTQMEKAADEGYVHPAEAESEIPF